VFVLIFFQYRLNQELKVPTYPRYPYFPTQHSELNGSKWDTYYFQPIFLKSFINDQGQTLLKTAYRDSANTIREINVFINGSISNSKEINARYALQDLEGSKTYYLAIEKLNLLEPGNQISIAYMISKGNPTELEYHQGSEEDTRFCEKIPDHCAIGAFSDLQYDQVYEFKSNHLILAQDFILPAFQLSQEEHNFFDIE